LSDKEHPWLISDDNVWKWGLHQRIPRILIARLRRLLQQNIVADRHYTYQRQTIGKGFILRQRDVFMLQLAARSAALSDARVGLEPVPDGSGVEIPIRAAGETGVSHDWVAVDGDLGIGGIARLLEDEFERDVAAADVRLGSRARGRRRVAVVVELEPSTAAWSVRNEPA
jgi:hypothetical protein